MPTSLPSSASPFEDDSTNAPRDDSRPESFVEEGDSPEFEEESTLETIVDSVFPPPPEEPEFEEESTLETIVDSVFPPPPEEIDPDAAEGTAEEEADEAALEEIEFQLPGLDDRERSLPIRQGDLTRLLLAEPGLTESDRTQLSALGKILGATFHSKFYGKLQQLKELYAPLDPDSDYVTLPDLSLQAHANSDELFLDALGKVLMRANYSPLDVGLIEQAISAPNEHGLTYVPDFTLFEHVKIWVRGYTRISRDCRTARTRFRMRTIHLDAYQRMVVALKFKPGLDLGSHVRSEVLYLRMFKDVPHVDMEMHLPEQGTKVRMRLIDKAQIASPIVMGIPTLALKFLSVVGLATASLSWGVLGGLVIAPISAGVNSFFGFHRAKRKHLSEMIHKLYYLTLANNASVLTRLIDSAEDEEYKEAMLAYFFLWRSANAPNPLREAELDVRIEAYLAEKTGIEINFEVRDALRKLFRLGLVTRDHSGGLHAVPIAQALVALDRQWDRTFRYS